MASGGERTSHEGRGARDGSEEAEESRRIFLGCVGTLCARSRPPLGIPNVAPPANAPHPAGSTLMSRTTYRSHWCSTGAQIEREASSTVIILSQVEESTFGLIGPRSVATGCNREQPRFGRRSTRWSSAWKSVDQKGGPQSSRSTRTFILSNAKIRSGHLECEGRHGTLR